MRIVRYAYPFSRGLTPAVGYSHRGPWSGLESEIDRLFSTAVNGIGALATGGQFPVDLFEDKENTYVRAELPGVTKEDVSVDLVDGDLTLTASRKQKTAEGEESASFKRVIEVPENVQTGKISAAFENGVLTVTLPKQEAVKPKKISVAVS